MIYSDTEKRLSLNVCYTRTHVLTFKMRTLQTETIVCLILNTKHDMIKYTRVYSLFIYNPLLIIGAVLYFLAVIS